MVSLVEQMLDLNRKLAATKLAHEKTALERQIGRLIIWSMSCMD
jgi:hypothetical protein